MFFSLRRELSFHAVIFYKNKEMTAKSFMDQQLKEQKPKNIKTN